MPVLGDGMMAALLFCAGAGKEESVVHEAAMDVYEVALVPPPRA
jgi:hypothetical protein